MGSSTKSLKTPLRYPGGKSRACVKMDQFLPDLNDYKEFREPFLGGGSVALHITKRYPHLNIWVNDLYEPLFNFWCQLQDYGSELEEKILDYKLKYNDPESARELFKKCKDDIDSSDSTPFDRAVDFYIINKCSFSGLTESSSFSSQASESNFSLRGIEKLSEYSELISDWTITKMNYCHMLTNQKNVFTYLDPPYDIKDNLYGKKGEMHKKFNHDDFATECDHYTGHQLISYNSSQLVKERFKKWNLVEFDHTYTMRSVGSYMSNQQQRKELLLFNYQLKEED